MQELSKDFHIHCVKGDVGRYVILPGDPGRCAAIAALFDNPRHVGQNREFNIYTGPLLGETVSVCSTGIGGPSAAIAMEELCNIGADTFLRVGTCGGIDLSVTNALVAAAKNLGYSYHTGVVQCKDSFYGQHSPARMPVSYELEQKWEAWKRLGVKASEMESATLFVVAAARGVRCGSCFHVIWNQEREKAGLDMSMTEDTSGAIKVGIEAMKRIIAGDLKK